jgi:hypothetical protein
MTARFITRRAALAVAASAAVQGPRVEARPSIREAPLTFPTPRDEMRAVIRVMGDLAGAQTPWWYTGDIFAVRPGEHPLKLVRFEGCEIYRFVAKEDGTWVQYARTTSFFHDAITGKLLTRWTNPYTQTVVDVRPNRIGKGGRMIWTAAGRDPQVITSSGHSAPSGGPQALKVTWVTLADEVWMRSDNAFPPGMPVPFSECSAMLVSRKDLTSARRSAIAARFSSTHISPFLGWMGMKGIDGHTVWHADGRKLEHVDQLPAAFRARIQALDPTQLEVTPD